jgi:superfamily II DNA/RNA helicase
VARSSGQYVHAGRREAITLTVTYERTHETGHTADHEVKPVYELDHSETGLPEDSDTSHPLLGDVAAPPGSPTFAELGVKHEIVDALRAAGIEHTFAIQELTLPLALRGEDVIGQARTGMGKTLSFGVPLLQRSTLPGDGTPQALVVVPTRELCLQVTHDLRDAGSRLKIRVLPVYGGRPYEPQIAALRRGVDAVVGTPGRLLDLAEQRHLALGKIRLLVLDEADEMLDLGFLPDVERILQMVPDQRQTMLFSATMPGPILTLARTFLRRPTHIRAEESHQSAIHEQTRQFVYRAHALDKIELVSRVLQARERGLTMIFARTKRTAQRLSDDLTQRGFAAAAVHGDLGQSAREQALRAFRTGKVDVLVATDVAARGIDVDDVTHVINYQCPEDEKTYVHRIGRTGRAGKAGVGITLVDWEEEGRWKAVDTALQLGIADPPETYSTSEHLFTDLDIPHGVTGRLPLSKRTRAGLAAEPEEDFGGRRRGARRHAGPAGHGASSGNGDGQPRRNRQRRRTRGGQPLSTTTAGTAATSDAEPSAATANGATATPAATVPAVVTIEQPERHGLRRRRRRRRGGTAGAQPEQSQPGGPAE